MSSFRDLPMEAPILINAEWDENKHPRAKDGKFSSGGSGSSTESRGIHAKGTVYLAESKHIAGEGHIKVLGGTKAAAEHALGVAVRSHNEDPGYSRHHWIDQPTVELPVYHHKK